MGSRNDDKILLNSDDFFENEEGSARDFARRIGNYVKRNFKGEDTVTLIARNSNWRGQTGYKYITLNKGIVEIGFDIIPSYDCTFILMRNKEKNLYAKVYSHDVPTGSTWEFKAGELTEEEIFS